MKDNLATGLSGKKRTVAIGVGLAAGAIASGTALLLGPGAAVAQPGATSNVVVQQPAAAPAAAAPAPMTDARTRAAVPAATTAAPAEDADQAARDVFYDAGYTYDDAVALGKAWHNQDAFQVKADAGRKLQAGETLPIKPGSSRPSAPGATKDDQAVAAFFNTGYTYDDAVALAKAWGTDDPYAAKIKAGKLLLAGETLPVEMGSAPSAEYVPSAADNRAVKKFFAAGYTYDDAVQLAALWHSDDPFHAKIAAGKKLLDGQRLPVAR